MKDRDKKVETEQLLGPLAEERFALFVNLAKKITDFGNEERTGTTGKFSNNSVLFLLSSSFKFFYNFR